MMPVLGTLKDGRAELPIAMGDIRVRNRTDFLRLGDHGPDRPALPWGVKGRS